MSKCEECGGDHGAFGVGGWPHRTGEGFAGKPVKDSREITLRLPADGRELARGLARGLAAGMVEMFSRPSFRAGLVGSTVAGAVCMRQGMRPLPAFLIMLMAHYAAEGLYGMAEDIRDNVAELVSRETASGGA